MTKKPLKLSSTQKISKRKAIFVLTTTALVVIALLFGLYKLYEYDSMLKNEAQSFASLKSDMLALQTDLNNIDPGWVYSEGCHRNGEVYKRNQASSCYINLRPPAQTSSSDHYIELLKSEDKLKLSYKQPEVFRDGDVTYLEYDLINNTSDRVACGFRVEKSYDKETPGRIGCSGVAHKFYFEASD